MADLAAAMLLTAEAYALEHPEDPRSADFLYELHEFKRLASEIPGDMRFP